MGDECARANLPGVSDDLIAVLAKKTKKTCAALLQLQEIHLADLLVVVGGMICQLTHRV